MLRWCILAVCVGLLPGPMAMAQSSRPSAQPPMREQGAQRQAASQPTSRPATSRPVSARASHWHEWLVQPKGSIGVERLRAGLQARGLLGGWPGLFVGTHGKEVRVCLRKKMWLRHWKHAAKAQQKLLELKRKLTARKHFGFHIVEDDHPQVQRLFLSWKQSLPKGVKAVQRSYNRPGSSPIGLDLHFKGTRAVLEKWVAQRNVALLSLFQQKKAQRHLRLLIGPSLGGGPLLRTYLVWAKASLSSDMLKRVQTQADPKWGRVELGLVFSKSGSLVFQRMTGAHIGHRFAMVLGDRVLVAPIIQSMIGVGRARITFGSFQSTAAIVKEARDVMYSVIAALSVGVSVKRATGPSRCAQIATQMHRYPPHVDVARAVAIRKKRAEQQQKRLHCMIRSPRGGCVHGAIAAMRWMQFKLLIRRRPSPSLVGLYKRRLLKDIAKVLLLSEKAQDKGIVVTAKEVGARLAADRSFWSKNRYSAKHYKRWLLSYDIDDASYRDWMKRSLLAQRFQASFMRSFVLTEATAWKMYAAHREKVQAWYLQFPRQSYKPSIRKLTSAQLLSWARVHQKEVAAYYQRHKKRFLGDAKVQARHILLRMERRASAKERKVARQKIEKLRQQLLKFPKAFASVARRFSHCPSRAKGGDLGVFHFGAMVPSFSRAAFALRRPGDISPVVKTRFGYHIIQLIARHPRRSIPLKSAQIPIAKILWRQKQQRAKWAFILGWFRSFWRKRTTGGDLISALQAHFASAKMRGDTPNGVIRFWQATSSQMRLRQTPMLRRHISGYIPGIEGRDPALVASIHQLTKQKPMLATPIWRKRSIYLFRLKRRVVPARKRFQREKQQWIKMYRDREASKAFHALVERLHKSVPLRMKPGLMKVLGEE